MFSTLFNEGFNYLKCSHSSRRGVKVLTLKNWEHESSEHLNTVLGGLPGTGQALRFSMFGSPAPLAPQIVHDIAATMFYSDVIVHRFKSPTVLQRAGYLDQLSPSGMARSGRLWL